MLGRRSRAEWPAAGGRRGGSGGKARWARGSREGRRRTQGATVAKSTRNRPPDDGVAGQRRAARPGVRGRSHLRLAVGVTGEVRRARPRADSVAEPLAFRRGRSAVVTRTPIWRAGALALTCLVVACGPSDAPSGPTDAPSASCNGDAECDDGNPCTDDACT